MGVSDQKPVTSGASITRPMRVGALTRSRPTGSLRVEARARSSSRTSPGSLSTAHRTAVLLGESEAARRPPKQLHAQLGLQRGDGPADRRYGFRRLTCGGRQAAGLDRPYEECHGLQAIHPHLPIVRKSVCYSPRILPIHANTMIASMMGGANAHQPIPDLRRR